MRRLPDSKLIKRGERWVVVAFTVLLAAVWILGEAPSFGVMKGEVSLTPPVFAGPEIVLLILMTMLLNTLFVAAETAVGLLRNSQVKALRETDPTKANRIQELIEARPTILASCTLGSQAARLALALLGFLLAPGLANTFADVGHWPLSYGSLITSAAIISVVVALLNMIVGELVPKSFAMLHPKGVSLNLYRFIRFTSIAFSAPAKVIVALAGIFTARFGGQASLLQTNQAEEEIKNLVESAEETGEIEKEEKELLHSVFSFTDKVAREVMTPRVDMDALPVQTDPTELIRLIDDSGHTRIPLFEGSDDQILGFVHAKDLLMALTDGTERVNVRKLMRPALFVPENKDLHELLKEMRQGRVQMAIVQDEFGGTAGIVTIEDIVEELVGDIADEYDDEVPEILKSGDDWILLGKTRLDDVNQAAGTSWDNDGFDTIGGYVFGLFGRQPKQGESMTADGWKFVVEETDGRRIMRVRLQKLSKLSDDSD